jgi:hypothetical protein
MNKIIVKGFIANLALSRYWMPYIKGGHWEIIATCESIQQLQKVNIPPKYAFLRYMYQAPGEKPKMVFSMKTILGLLAKNNKPEDEMFLKGLKL